MTSAISVFKIMAKSEIDTAKQSMRRRKLSGNCDPSHMFGMRIEAKSNAHKRSGHFWRETASNKAHAPTLNASPIQLPAVVGSPAKTISSQSVVPIIRESTKRIPSTASRRFDRCIRSSPVEVSFVKWAKCLIADILRGLRVEPPSPISAHQMVRLGERVSSC
jgi:hypothetical protein